MSRITVTVSPAKFRKFKTRYGYNMHILKQERNRLIREARDLRPDLNPVAVTEISYGTEVDGYGEHGAQVTFDTQRENWLGF